MREWLKKLFVLMAIAFMAVQPVFIPTVYAVESWTGDPWEGDTWNGDAWDGYDLKWKGNTWQGDTWTGDSWNGDGSDGSNSWKGQNWNGIPWYLRGWSQDGMTGNPWYNDSFNGNRTTGSPWKQPGFGYGPGGTGDSWSDDGYIGNGTPDAPWVQLGFSNGLSGLANPWLMPGYNSNGTNGGSFDGNGAKDDPSSLEDFPSLPQEYDVGKYVVKDIMMGQVNLAGNLQTYQNMQNLGYNTKMSYGGRFSSSLFMNGLKLGVGDNVVFGAYDTYTHVSDGIGGVKDYNYIRNAQKTTDTAGDLASASSKISGKTPPAASVGALSKFNVAAAAVGTGISAFETGFKSAKAVDVWTSDASGADKTSAVADAGASAGNTLMNAGVVATAIPGGQAVGAGMVAVGAGIWAVSKGAKFVADNWKGNLKDTGKAMWNKTKDTAKKAWDTVTGLFS
ncbi:hypothetical protein GCM10007063_33810 [Lentibacillus kapialis]|uniref:Uncharacterized protein n=1 Tax=Lentibacillus kapialis TaxID=340214 RepID=A0A917Q2P5_9BACI|nr:hypothetical protein [Lentibacillus kapialis]GGK08634.1 hypothetical protein GCM10007063_33810 [Lentibacillus kapialis]